MSITAAIHKDLLAWFRELPVWQNEAFRQILTKGKFDDQDIKAIIAIAFQENGLVKSATPLPDKLNDGDLPTIPAATTATPPRLLALHSLANVNMLAPNQRLDFGQNLTLIYGGNGAGKSGYARVLKKACRCNERAHEEILPNVYQNTVAGTASASFEVDDGGTTTTVPWQPGKAVPILRHFAVFDSKAARIFITERNEVPSPLVFTKLESLGGATKAVKDQLAQQAAAEAPSSTALNAFVDETTTGKIIAAATAQTPVETLDAALVWSAADDSTLEDRERQLVTFKAQGPQALRKMIQDRRRRITALIRELEAVEQTLSADKIEVVRKQQLTCKELAAAKALAASKALGQAPLPGTGTAPWETLLTSAARFFNEGVEPSGMFPGTAGSTRCVLCQQTLTADAHARLLGFWEYLNDTAAKRFAEAEGQLARLVQPFVTLPATTPASLTTIASQLAEDVPDVWTRVSSFFTACVALRDGIVAAAKSGNWNTLPQAPTPLSPECRKLDDVLRKQDAALGDPTAAAAELTRLTAAVKELTSRKRAAESRAAILEHHIKLRRSSLLHSLSDQISTGTISNKVTALQKQYVTEEFRKRLQDEATALGLKRARPSVAPKTERGRTTHAVTINGATTGTPETVFSEGERCALALAFFIVELGTQTDTPCAIFDDPVCSLDHRIRAKVVDRLTALATTRQVVVFTHDLPFFCELQTKAEREKVPVEIRSIQTAGRIVGAIRVGAPFIAMPVAERETVLQELINKTRVAETSGTPEDVAVTAFQFYGGLRSTWERAVEELLFNKVVSRFEEEVKTKSLTGVVIDDKAIKTVFAAMSKCSGLIDGHDHAVALNENTPDADEMKADLEMLTTFRTTHKKKRQVQEETLKHLKA